MKTSRDGPTSNPSQRSCPKPSSQGQAGLGGRPPGGGDNLRGRGSGGCLRRRDQPHAGVKGQHLGRQEGPAGSGKAAKGTGRSDGPAAAKAKRFSLRSTARALPPSRTQTQPASAAVLPPSPPVTTVVPQASVGPAPRAASGPRPSPAGAAGVGQVRGPARAGAAYRAPGSSSTTRAAPGPARSRCHRRRRSSELTDALPTSPDPSPVPRCPAGS